jgi:hypothetical protein
MIAVRLLALAIAVVFLVGVAAVAAGADTQADLDAARKNLADARNAANGAVGDFEIRVGGANGSRINPYPTLKSASC